MSKDRRIQIRVNGDLLDQFDRFIGEGNRSRKIHELMEKELFVLQKKEDRKWHNKQ